MLRVIHTGPVPRAPVVDAVVRAALRADDAGGAAGVGAALVAAGGGVLLVFDAADTKRK